MDLEYTKTFYEIKSVPSIAAILMVKNEEKNIEKTLKSVVGQVDCIVIYDTGSTDETVNIIKKFSEIQKINLKNNKLKEIEDSLKNLSIEIINGQEKIIAISDALEKTTIKAQISGNINNLKLIYSMENSSILSNIIESFTL